jgi:outer membrane protein
MMTIAQANHPGLFMLTLALTCAFAAGDASAKDCGERGWTLQLGLGAGYFPDYVGSGSSTVQLVPAAVGSWCTESWGTVELDTASSTVGPTLTWKFLDREDWSLGLQTALRYGRTDQKAGGLRLNAGSTSLKGLNDIEDVFDLGGQATLNLAEQTQFYVQARTAGGNGGWLVESGIYAEIPLSPRLGIALIPSIAWGDGSYTTKYFGVTPTEAVRSGFRAYAPGAGLTGASFEIAAEYGFTREWSLIVDLGYTRLLGDAADSPIVTDRNQWGGFALIAYRF